MSLPESPLPRVGCDSCRPPEPNAAWEARRRLTQLADLIDESHLHIQLLSCPACGQDFASVFSESVDWVDGDDPQYWCLLPLSHQTLAALRGPSADDLLGTLASAAAAHPVLHRDAPKGAPTRVFWSPGLRVLG